MKAIHDLVELGKDRGYITQDELDGVLPAEGTNRRAMAGLIEDMDIEVLDGEAEVDFEEDEAEGEAKGEASSRSVDQYDAEGSDSGDPIKVYFREMSQKGLLDREGEVRLARAIEQGQQAAAAPLHVAAIARAEFPQLRGVQGLVARRP